MNSRTWMVAAGAVVLSAVVLGGAMSWANREKPAVVDAGGQTAEDALSLDLRRQFDEVGKRYRELNDLISDTQLKIYVGEWVGPGGGTAFMVNRGSAFPSELNGEATASNSYYLKRIWKLESADNAEEYLDSIKQYWESKGWETSKQDSDVAPGEYWVTARSPEGHWISLDMFNGGLLMRAHSGVYWGDREALATAIWNIQQTELNEGTNWRPEKTNADGDGLIRPGEYPPFPEWRAVALEERMPKSRSQLE